MTDSAHQLRVAIGLELRDARERAGLSRRRLAALTEGAASATFIEAVETGRGNPSFVRVARMARALGLSLAEIAERAEKRVRAGE
ncbi:helix-turn-helix domain-containing protein [Conexibacter arvalis]|uniref:Transcriptional regulator with XRE-family HTH domain n=1 Tax=Conexibacter arvalis TaxID=912552 RepID=A0A840IGF2_9ACTN|nr:helix-turn-helix transcriptional regulator [Conexibacter arvalis]MBB4663020.1 transcriptional regulator with XRE-family HTH domain [Conexibacter arvalis]